MLESFILRVIISIAGYSGVAWTTFLLLGLAPAQVRFKCFMTFICGTMAVSGLYSLAAHPFFWLIGRHDLAHYTTSWLWWNLAAFPTGLRVQIEGEDKLKGWGGKRSARGPCIFAVNHQSELDVFLLARVSLQYGDGLLFQLSLGVCPVIHAIGLVLTRDTAMAATHSGMRNVAGSVHTAPWTFHPPLWYHLRRPTKVLGAHKLRCATGGSRTC
jgi:hypothetical protein